MENGSIDLGMYLSINQYHLLYTDASYRALAPTIKNAFGNNPAGTCDGYHAGCFAKEI
jgi:hypothetical protein